MKVVLIVLFLCYFITHAMELKEEENKWEPHIHITISPPSPRKPTSPTPISQTSHSPGAAFGLSVDESLSKKELLALNVYSSRVRNLGE